MSPRAKICGLTRPGDARLAGTLGASYVGAVLYPRSPRRVTPEQAARLGREAGVRLVLVTVDTPVDELVRAARTAGAAVLQLHGSEGPSSARALAGEGWEVWKAARVGFEEDLLALAERWAGVADLLLLDARHPEMPGGTGRRFPWEALEAVREAWPHGLGLGVAGGLAPENVREAVSRLRPDLVDVSTGVEARPGIKDPKKLRAFLEAVRSPAAGADPAEKR